MELIKVKNDWTWIVNHAKDMLMEDSHLHKDILRIAKEKRLDIIRIIDLYSEGLSNGAENGKYLSFKDWFYEFFQL